MTSVGQANLEKIDALIQLGIALSAERDLNTLLRKILDGALKLSNAETGTIYFKTKRDTLQFAIRSRTDELPFSEIPLRNPTDGTENRQFVSVYTALTGSTVTIDDIYSDDTPFDLTGTRHFDEQTGYRSRSMLCVPMTGRNGDIVGVMQIINAKQPDTGEVTRFSKEDSRLLEALAAQAAISLENYRLFESQEELLDAFIKVLASAIDAKSPYTGGHCARVPNIAFMLAEAAVECNEGVFKHFSFNEEEWREFRVAGWLHDCGKVTTPEYVVDKDTKLSTLYNRIHEIRMRFEVLRRDAEIEYLRRRSEQPEEEATLKVELDKTLKQLEDDFTFIAECNVGSEFMSDEAVERLRHLSEKTWVRHYDNRLGLSNMDLYLLKSIPPRPAPCMEQLIDDKPEHIIPREKPDTQTPVNLETVMKVPEHQFNRGERYNLSIRKGTLTEEERYIINDHIVQTIIMLRKLPFPETLQRVPEYAGGHHEKMDGTGYPLGLKQSELSIPARIIAVADIFEALTACDRPYKKAKSIEESLKIMSFMVKDQHIDADIFGLFLKSGLFKRYAREFLGDPNLDHIDINQYLSVD